MVSSEKGAFLREIRSLQGDAAPVPSQYKPRAGQVAGQTRVKKKTECKGKRRKQQAELDMRVRYTALYVHYTPAVCRNYSGEDLALPSLGQTVGICSHRQMGFLSRGRRERERESVYVRLTVLERRTRTHVPTWRARERATTH